MTDSNYLSKYICVFIISIFSHFPPSGVHTSQPALNALNSHTKKQNFKFTEITRFPYYEHHIIKFNHSERRRNGKKGEANIQIK